MPITSNSWPRSAPAHKGVAFAAAAAGGNIVAPANHRTEQMQAKRARARSDPDGSSQAARSSRRRFRGKMIARPTKGNCVSQEPLSLMASEFYSVVRPLTNQPSLRPADVEPVWQARMEPRETKVIVARHPFNLISVRSLSFSITSTSIGAKLVRSLVASSLGAPSL